MEVCADILPIYKEKLYMLSDFKILNKINVVADKLLLGIIAIYPMIYPFQEMVQMNYIIYIVNVVIVIKDKAF